SLIWMTSFIQLAAGALMMATLFRHTGPVMLALLLCLTTVALNISVFHLGRPAYAWRALKMWRRSWLSREVLLCGIFLVTLAAATAAAWAGHAPSCGVRTSSGLAWAAAVFGVAGTIASAFIYLVPARPAWNMIHTPIDFLLSAAMIGSTLP